MKQRTRRLAVVFGGALLAAALVLAACSTDNGQTPLPGQTGEGGAGSKDGKADGGSVEEEDDSGAPKDGGGADCAVAPKLRENDNGGFFCAFFTRDAAAGDAGAGGNRNCRNDEICCNSGAKPNGDFPPSFCASDNGSCADFANDNNLEWVQARSSSWECADNNACSGGDVCCIYTWADAGPMDKVNLGPSQDNNVPKACNAKQAYKAGGTRCASACASDEIQLCSLSDDNCSGNQKCTPFSGLFRDLGACQ